ncbi:MAG: hypothetical protein WCS85_00935 [Candidatus Peribacteraceae bacterium]|jgi:hypothetical protein
MRDNQPDAAGNPEKASRPLVEVARHELERQGMGATDEALAEMFTSVKGRKEVVQMLGNVPEILQRYGHDLKALEHDLEMTGQNLEWLQRASQEASVGRNLERIRAENVRAKPGKPEVKESSLGWSLQKLKDVVLYPIRHPVKTAVIATILIVGGAILGATGAAYIERFYRSVGLGKLVEAAKATLPLNRVFAGGQVPHLPPLPPIRPDTL